MNAVQPWLNSVWNHLTQALSADRLGHAYLICGHHGLGKLTLARKFLGVVLCERRLADVPCESCRSCELYSAGNHPDAKLIGPDEDRKSIVIDQIRELIEFYALKSHYRGRKIALFYPADAMNHAAANALLKILEEPPAGALLLLVAHNPGLLPATIASRCQRLAITGPNWDETATWLAASVAGRADLPAFTETVLHGAPLAILEQVNQGRAHFLNEMLDELAATRLKKRGALEAAQRYNDIDLSQFLNGLEAIIQAAIALLHNIEPSHLLLPALAREQLQEISNKLNSKQLFLFLDSIAEARSAAQRSSGVRATGLIESLWLGWQRI